MTRRKVLSGLLTIVAAVTLSAFTTGAAGDDDHYGSPGKSTSTAKVIAVHIDGRLGPYLTDGTGRPLYTRQAGQEGSECVERCAEIWLPFVVDELPQAGDELVRDDFLGHVRRFDGRSQVTYGGQPLFFYVLDEERSGADVHEAARTLGQGVHDDWGSWSLLDPDGRRVEGLLDPR